MAKVDSPAGPIRHSPYHADVKGPRVPRTVKKEIQDAEPLVPQEESVALLRRMDSHQQSASDKLIYAKQQIGMARSLIERETADVSIQIDFWEPLREGLSVIQGLPDAFKRALTQEVVDVFLAGIWRVEEWMEYFSQKLNPTDFILCHDTYERAVRSFGELCEAYTKERLYFPPHEFSDAYDQMIRQVSRNKDTHPVGFYQEMEELAVLAGHAATDVKTQLRPSREAFMLIAIADEEGGYRFGVTTSFAGEIEYFGFDVPAANQVGARDGDTTWNPDALIKYLQEDPPNFHDFVSEFSTTIKWQGEAAPTNDIITILGPAFESAVLGTDENPLSNKYAIRALGEWGAVYKSLAPAFHQPAKVQERLITWARQGFDQALAEYRTEYFDQGSYHMMEYFLDTLIPNVVALQADLGLAPGAILTATQQDHLIEEIRRCLAGRVSAADDNQSAVGMVGDLRKVSALFTHGDKLADQLGESYLGQVRSLAVAPSVAAPLVDPTTAQNREEVLRLGRLYVAQLRSYGTLTEKGFNTVYGPLADVASPDGKSFLEQAGRASAHAPSSAGFLALLTQTAADKKNSNLGYVLKHAPGIGSIARNPEYENLVIDTRYPEEIAADFESFRLAYGLHPARTAVMVSGVSFPGLENSPSVFRPGAFSPDVCSWIRDRLGQDVVLFSDDIGRQPFMDYLSKVVSPQAQFSDGVIMAAKAGIDVCLVYSPSPEFFERTLQELAGKTANGEYSREDLEESVVRILNYKKQLFPDSDALADPATRVESMTIEELWAQKIIFPTWRLSDSREFLSQGIGGLTFEGINNPLPYSQMVAEWLAANPDEIPPLLANNSPQEVGDMQSTANPYRATERQILRDLAAAIEKAYPEGLTSDQATQLLDEIMKSA